MGRPNGAQTDLDASRLDLLAPDGRPADWQPTRPERLGKLGQTGQAD